MVAENPEPEALLFDLGNVVIEIDFGRVFDAWSTASGVPAQTLGERFSFDAHYQRHERGEISAAEYFGSLRSSLGVQLSDEEFARGWNAVFVGEVPGIAAVLQRARAHFPLHVFSNSNHVHHAWWAREYEKTLRVFHKVFVSSDMGRRKPEPGAFLAVAQDIGVPLPQILFFDDTAENVLAARRLGMQAVHVKAPADIEQALARLRPGGWP